MNLQPHHSSLKIIHGKSQERKARWYSIYSRCQSTLEDRQIDPI